jgi:hypothetical protein
MVALEGPAELSSAGRRKRRAQRTEPKLIASESEIARRQRRKKRFRKPRVYPPSRWVAVLGFRAAPSVIPGDGGAENWGHYGKGKDTSDEVTRWLSPRDLSPALTFAPRATAVDIRRAVRENRRKPGPYEPGFPCGIHRRQKIDSIHRWRSPDGIIAANSSAADWNLRTGSFPQASLYHSWTSAQWPNRIAAIGTGIAAISLSRLEFAMGYRSSGKANT